MSKKRQIKGLPKPKKPNKPKHTPLTQSWGNSEAIEMGKKHFELMHGDLELLTDELMDELLKKGWEQKVLDKYRSMGLKYSRQRNSFWPD